ncbi:hypothetical protein BDN72DRAFT_378122 [Pluteus cervinus]|uniref:Uncharacterized protein n=1 Tax=Pluteus cervinus TaxID=181527 RepID=A0ACD3B2R8_9AGAR|nr:hypothetical protein BDN72DRAFT_378122 [Pluteus cervinus]
MDATNAATTSSTSTSSHPQGATPSILQSRLNTTSRPPHLLVTPSAQTPSASSTPAVSRGPGHAPLTEAHVESPFAHHNGFDHGQKSTYHSSSSTWSILCIILWGWTAQFYVLLLFRFPAMYFDRFAHVLEHMDLTRQQVDDVVYARRRSEQQPQPNLGHVAEAEIPQGLVRFRKCWESLMESLSKEWETMNIVSVLLLGIDVGMIQISDIASQAPTRAASLLSLLCSLTSLLCGCIYAMRTPSMRRVTESTKWIEETIQHKTVLWNVWVLIAMPAIWLVWSIVFFLLNVMLYTWQTGTELTPMTKNGSIIVRTVVTFTFVLQMFYLALVIITLFRWSKPPRRSWKMDDFREPEPPLLHATSLGFQIPASDQGIPLSNDRAPSPTDLLQRTDAH